MVSIGGRYALFVPYIASDNQEWEQRNSGFSDIRIQVVRNYRLLDLLRASLSSYGNEIDESESVPRRFLEDLN